MSKNLLIILLLNLLSYKVEAQGNTKILLAANTADSAAPDTLINMVDLYCSTETARILWVLNGDLFPDDYADQTVEKWLDNIISLLDKYPNLQVLINQGDRDWGHGADGWAHLQQLQGKLQSVKHKRLRIFFEDGCPGPWTFALSEHLQVIVMNSEWFNRTDNKPMPSMNLCSADADIFIEDLRDLIEENSNKNILLLSHYPIVSVGIYGGRFPVGPYLWPPIFGLARVAFHQQVGNSKDLSNESYSDVRSRIEDLLREYSGIIMASGHEKNHSVIVEGRNVHINSGAVAPGEYVAPIKGFGSTTAGMIETNCLATGEVTFRLIEKNKYGNSRQLWSSPCEQTQVDNRNPAFDSCAVVQRKQVPDRVGQHGFTKMAAGPNYGASRSKRFWLGQHYRSSWMTPVAVQYLDMDSTFGGFTVLGRGGGRQTNSLKVAATNGKEYVFRSVDKDPSKALSYSLRGTIFSEIVMDQTTTQQPYGALATDHLMNRIGILHASPKLYVMPADPKLGSYLEDFKGMMGLLEERPTDKIKKENIFSEADHIEKSNKLFSKLYDDHDNHVDAYEFAKARVFDILVGDWGKHEDNWKWAGFKTKEGEMFRPIPRDRDHVFSRWDGVLPFLADREWAKPSGEDFDYTIKDLRSLMWQARHLDRQLASPLSQKDWLNAANEIQNAISDRDVEMSISKMPPEIFPLDGKTIEAKLKQRLKDLHHYAGRYYRMLAEQVDVVGSNKKEFFQVERKADGSVAVDVYDLKHETDQPNTDRPYYSRTFLPDETREVRLFGLMDDDVFVIRGDSRSSILVRIIGGDGNDRIDDSSNAKGKQTLIYENDSLAKIKSGPTTKRVASKWPDLYEYSRNAFVYNTYFPSVLLTYNVFTGLALQGGVSFTRHNFDKPDFSARHSFKGLVSVERNYGFEYENQLRHVIGKWDLVSSVNISRPINYNYFFGIGNNTENSEERGKNYYRAQYDLFGLTAGVTKAFWRQSLVRFALHFERDESLPRKNSYLDDNPDVFGNGVIHMYYLQSNLDLDFRDATALPERGFRLFMSNYTGHIAQASSDLSSMSEFGIEQYLSTYSTNPITVGVRLGGGVVAGEMPYYKLLSLGQLDGLRGFKRNRFLGEQKAYLNTEVRWQILERKNTLIPLKLGIGAFFDLGRVGADTDTSKDKFYHIGYGIGFYAVPFVRQAVLTISAGFSKEEPFLLMFGIGSNSLRKD